MPSRRKVITLWRDGDETGRADCDGGRLQLEARDGKRLVVAGFIGNSGIMREGRTASGSSRKVKMASSKDARRFGLAGLPFLACAAFGLSGCVAAGPTYGTGKGANEQLFDDVTSIVSFTPKRGEPIDYKPRPELVKPATTAVLPPPQDDIKTASAGAWPESPEERLARIRREATENRDNPGYRAPVIVDVQTKDPGEMSTKEQREEYRRRRAEMQGSPDQRKYLSEPPVEYRQPSGSAPADDLGEPEWRKERDAKRAARKSSGKKSWTDYVPFM